MKRILLALLLLPMMAHAQTITVGSTTTQLNPSQRGSVASFWPDGNMGAINHLGTNYVFAPTTNPGVVQVTIPNLNTWSSGLSIVNPSTNIPLGGSGAFDNNYVGGGAVYFDSTSGILLQLYHGEYWFGGGGSPFYSAIGLAYSTDFGVHWHKLGEVISPQSLRVNGGVNCQAEVGNGTLLVVGSYFYAYYTDMPSGCSSYPQIAVARASISSVIAAAVAGTPFTSGPGTLFMKYTGSGAWTGNGVTDLANPQNGGGAFVTVATDGAGNGQYEPNVRYDSVSNSYIMVYATITGINAQTSTNGLTWGNQQTIKSGGGGFGSSTQYYYPTLFNTSGGDPQALGTNFSVFYVYPFNPPGSGWSASSVYSTALSVPGSSGSCTGTGPYVCTAATANESDVNAVINGPTHTAGNGDTIQIPCSGTQSVTWSSTLTITANITLTALGGTPNSGSSTFGAGTNCLTIVDNNTSGWLIYATPTYSASNNVTTIQNFNIDPQSASTALYTPITFEGTGTSSGMPQARIDNIVFGKGTQWTEGGNSANAVTMMKIDNVVGVADHNTIPAGSAVELGAYQMSSYLGVGSYGDNSWAQPDSIGGANNWFNENNLINSYIVITDCTEGGPSFSESGGCRLVNRFNHVLAGTMFQMTGMHGTDTGGRPRSGRHTETYGNTVNCSGTCNDLTATFRGGTGVVWGNTGTTSGGGFYGEIFDVGIYRPVYMNSPFGACGGLSSIDPWDTIDNTVYYSGTISSGSGTLTITTSFSGLPNLAPLGAPYSVYDVTQNFVTQITSNTTNTITTYGPISEEPWVFHNGDSIQIIRATVCIDQSGRGQGGYISGTSPTPTTALNQALDPVYEWGDSVAASSQFIVVDSGQIIQNRDFYTDNWRGGSLSGPTQQSSATVPFNGSTTCNNGSGNYVCGVGEGTLANRPSTCTTGVVYAEYSGGSFVQLDKCSSTNTWTNAAYVPYTYPYPLAGGTPQTATPTFSPGTGSYAPPVSVTISAPVSSIIYYTTDGSTPTTSSSVYSSPLSISSNTTLQAVAKAPGYLLSAVGSAVYTFATPTCLDPSQNAPFSGSYVSPPTTLPLNITWTNPTTGCVLHYTNNGSTPTCSSSSYPGGGLNISVTTVVRVIACQSGYINSNVIGGTWTINSQASAPIFSPTSPFTGGATTVTASTSTSGCSGYIYFDTSNPPLTIQTTYSFTTSVTLYAYVHGCPSYADSTISVWSGVFASPQPPTLSGALFSGIN